MEITKNERIILKELLSSSYVSAVDLTNKLQTKKKMKIKDIEISISVLLSLGYVESSVGLKSYSVYDKVKITPFGYHFLKNYKKKFAFKVISFAISIATFIVGVLGLLI